MQKVLYEDEKIIVIRQSGHSKELLVTFGDLTFLANGTRFFADKPARKLGFNCLGFMSKGPDWYPAPNMAAALGHLKSYISSFSERIVYGASMGGYGALKFSGLLGASCVIALCPQWSLDPTECRGADPGWRHLFVSSMHGMGICPGDIGGRAYVFLDPLSRQDNFHGSMISEVWPTARLIPVPFVGHHVTPVMVGGETLREMILACRQDDVIRLYRLSRQQRRLSEHYGQSLLARIIDRRPKAALRYFVDAASGSNKSTFAPGMFVVKLAENFARNGDLQSATACLETLTGPPYSQIRQAILAELKARLSKGRGRFLTVHDTTLVYDVGSGSCRHMNPTDGDGLRLFLPITIRMNGNKAVFSVQTDAAEIYLGLSPARHLVAEAGQVTEFEIVPGEGDDFHLWHEGLFLCAEPYGQLICNRPAPGPWESFSFKIVPGSGQQA